MERELRDAMRIRRDDELAITEASSEGAKSSVVALPEEGSHVIDAGFDGGREWSARYGRVSRMLQVASAALLYNETGHSGHPCIADFFCYMNDSL